MGKKVTLEEVGEMLEHVVKHMATKEDLKEELEGFATKEDLKQEIGPIKTTLNDHTRSLNQIETDVKQNLDKRLQLEVRVKKVEEKVGL